MAKKKSSLFSLSNLLYIGALVLGVVAICMIMTTSLTIEGSVGSYKGTTGVSGIKVVFGAEDDGFLFSFMNLVPYILLVAAVVLLVLKVLGKMNGGLANIVATVLFVVAGVMFLMVPNFVVLEETFKKLFDLALKTELVKKVAGTGAIISAICSFVAGVCSLVPLFTKK